MPAPHVLDPVVGVLTESIAPAIREVLLTPAAIAATVVAVYVLWLAAVLHGGSHVHDFIHISPGYLTGSTASRAIVDGPVRPDGSAGYDGQFSYYLAVDPLGARSYLDYPSYRLGRLAYPLAARLLALGDASRVATTLVLVNLLAVLAGTLALASWLRRRQLPAWLAVVYGLAPGNLFALQRDTVDASAVAVTAIAVYLLDRSVILAGVAFGLAGLTRETTLVFAAVFLAAELLRRRRPRSHVLGAAALALAPEALWKLWLWHWVGRTEVPIAYNFTPIPLGGVAHWVLHPNAAVTPGIAAVVIPGLIAFAIAGWAILRGRSSAALVLTVLVVAAGMVFVARHPYEEIVSATRTTIAIPLAATLMLPALRERGWWWLCAGLWLSPVPGLLLIGPA
jgi:hypothetical protein